MDAAWGFPAETFEEGVVSEADSGDWQWWARAVGEDIDAEFTSNVTLLGTARQLARGSGETAAAYTRRCLMLVLAVLRHHSMRDSAENRWCRKAAPRRRKKSIVL